MHFCEVCGNMYYLKIADNQQDAIIYYCRNCGHEDTNITTTNICVSKTQIKRKEQKHSHNINEYTKQDPTLPRINTIKCPNQSCQSNKDNENREVIYIRYDDTNMKYIYLCAVCDTTWKTDEQK